MAKARVRKPEMPAGKTVFALDIGTRSIIGMVGTVEDGKVKIIAIDKAEHTNRAMIDGQIENIEKVSQLAGQVKKRLEDKVNFRLDRVCVAAAGRALRTKRADFELELPGAQLIDDEVISRLEAGAISKAEDAFDDDNLNEGISRRFYLVGYTVCQYYLDNYMMSSLKDHRGQKVKVDLIATFLPSEVVESLYTTMHKIGLEVASITLEPIAAINSTIPENLRLLNLVMVDIGAGTSDIAACMNGSVTGYTMATLAGDEVTETIMKEYLVDFKAAENIKAQMDFEEEITFTDILGFEQTVPRPEILQCIQSTSGLICKEISEKILEVNGGPPSALFLAGGGSKLTGLKDGLTAALQMNPNRVAIAGKNFQASAFSDEYDLNNPEYATPLGIAISSGLNMINDSFRVILNGKPAKLFRSGSFTVLNLLMMNGYSFQDIMGRSGLNLIIMVNGKRKVFYGTAAQPASLFINKQEGKLSEIVHAGDCIDFIPAVHGTSATACLGDIEGAQTCLEILLNGRKASLRTPLKNGDVVIMDVPPKKNRDMDQSAEEKGRGKEPASGNADSQQPGDPAGTGGDKSGQSGDAASGGGFDSGQPEDAANSGFDSGQPGNTAASGGAVPGQLGNAANKGGGKSVQPVNTAASAGAAPGQPGNAASADSFVSPQPKSEAVNGGGSPRAAAQPGGTPADSRKPASSALASAPIPPIKKEITFTLNGAAFPLPVREDGRPYYLMDMLEYSGIDFEHVRGEVLLRVNGSPGFFQQQLKEGDVILITEKQR